MARHQRKLRWVRPDFQRKVILTFFSVACLFVLVQTVVTHYALVRMAGKMTEGGDQVIGQIPNILGFSLWICSALLLPAMVGFGWVLTHRIAGPVHRFEAHLNRIADGAPVTPVTIRDGDEFESLCDAINRATRAIEERSQSQNGAEERQAA